MFSVSTGLRLCGMAEEPFALREEFFRFQHLGALEDGGFGGHALHRGGDDAERGEEHGGAVARNHLGRDRLDGESHLLRDMCSQRRVRSARSSRPRRRSRGWRCRRAPRPGGRAVALESSALGLRQLGVEGGRLGMDAVRGGRWSRPMLCSKARFFSAASSRSISSMRMSAARASCTEETGVEHVGRGHALVDEVRFRPDDLGQMGQEGDDVVLHLGLDGVDAADVELRRRPWPSPRSSPRPPSAPRRARPVRRWRAPRSRTRCGSGSAAPRWRPSRDVL